MENFTLIYGPISYLFFSYKIMCGFIIFSLFVYFNLNSEYNNKYLLASQAGINDNTKKLFVILGGVLGNISAYITIKNELTGKELMNKINEINTKKEEINKLSTEIDDLKRKGYESLIEFTSIKNNVKIAKNNTADFHNRIDNLVITGKKINNVNYSENTNIEEIKTLLKEYENNRNNVLLFFKEHQLRKEYNKLLIENQINIAETETSNALNSSNEVQNSNILGSLLENFENLSGIKQLAVSLLLLNIGLVSSLISIIFIYFGDYLLTKYNLEEKYPKLAIIISMRQKFKRSYLYLNISFILIIIFTQVIFSLAILML